MAYVAMCYPANRYLIAELLVFGQFEPFWAKIWNQTHKTAKNQASKFFWVFGRNLLWLGPLTAKKPKFGPNNTYFGHLRPI